MNSRSKSFVFGFKNVVRDDADWFDKSDWGQQIPTEARKYIRSKMTGKNLDDNADEVGKHYKDWIKTPRGHAISYKQVERDFGKKWADRWASEQLEKKAAPAWYYEMNRTMNPLKSMKNQSKIGLKVMKAAKGLK